MVRPAFDHDMTDVDVNLDVLTGQLSRIEQNCRSIRAVPVLINVEDQATSATVLTTLFSMKFYFPSDTPDTDTDIELFGELQLFTTDAGATMEAEIEDDATGQRSNLLTHAGQTPAWYDVTLTAPDVTWADTERIINFRARSTGGTGN